VHKLKLVKMTYNFHCQYKMISPGNIIIDSHLNMAILYITLYFVRIQKVLSKGNIFTLPKPLAHK